MRKGPGLLDHIKLTLAEFGLKVNTEQLEALLLSGRVLLLLDGFDEVDDDDKSWLIDEIEHLTKCYDSMRVVSVADDERHPVMAGNWALCVRQGSQARFAP